MRAVFAGAVVAAFVVTPALADYYIIQEPTTKRCRIVEERPASPSIGVVIGGAGFGVRTEAESRMRIVEECRESGASGGGTVVEETKDYRIIDPSGVGIKYEVISHDGKNIGVFVSLPAAREAAVAYAREHAKPKR